MLSPRFSTKSYEPHPNLTVGVLGLGPEGAPSEIKFRSLSKLIWKVCLDGRFEPSLINVNPETLFRVKSVWASRVFAEVTETSQPAVLGSASFAMGCVLASRYEG